MATALGIWSVSGLGRTVDDAGTRVARDRNSAVAIAVPADWEVEASPVAGESYGNGDPGVVPDLTASGGVFHTDQIDVWVEDPAQDATAQAKRQHAIAVQDCIDYPCDQLSGPRRITVASYPALEQVMTASDEDGDYWTLIRTMSTPNAILHIEVYTDAHDAASERRLRAMVDGIRVGG